LALNDLAVLYFRMGRTKDCEKYYKIALEKYEAIYGVNHPYYGDSLCNLAKFYLLNGDKKSAEPLFKLALEIYKERYGKEHKKYIDVVNDISSCSS